jgi:hypothetical protein
MSSAGDESARFLGRASGYVSDPHRGLHAEPQAVTEAEQHALTERAQRNWQREQQRQWGKARASINGALNSFKSSSYAKPLISDLRVIERQVARIDKQVGL